MIFCILRRSCRTISSKMSAASSILSPPASVRGMKVLDREKFLRNIQVPILKVTEEKLSKITSLCKPYFLKLENFKPVQSLQEESFKKCIFLSPEKVTNWNDINENIRTSFKHHEVDETNFAYKEIYLSYDNFKFDDIFKAVLPENADVVSGFSQIGHIIHLNLRDHQMEYRTLIGEVLVDKVKTCRTVVNKINIIDTTYRNFCMEVIAGDKDFLVTVKENKCTFQFDFSKVYWNPRLSKEHERILDIVKPGDILFDVFCGVGPFSIPAAKKKCKVFANDLNPESFKWLNHNAKSNKVNIDLFKSYNQDGKDFICSVFKDYLIDYCSGKEKINNNAKIHVTMNLPAMAVEFLTHFNGLIKDKELLSKLDKDIIVYLYCFVLAEDPTNTAKDMVNKNVGSDISENIIDIFHVRNVAPNKEMMRVTFKLSKDIIYGESNETGSEPPVKKLCSESESVLNKS